MASPLARVARTPLFQASDGAHDRNANMTSLWTHKLTRHRSNVLNKITTQQHYSTMGYSRTSDPLNIPGR